jgi:hypothetical protein
MAVLDHPYITVPFGIPIAFPFYTKYGQQETKQFKHFA